MTQPCIHDSKSMKWVNPFWHVWHQIGPCSTFGYSMSHEQNIWTDLNAIFPLIFPHWNYNGRTWACEYTWIWTREVLSQPLCVITRWNTLTMCNASIHEEKTHVRKPNVFKVRHVGNVGMSRLPLNIRWSRESLVVMEETGVCVYSGFWGIVNMLYLLSAYRATQHVFAVQWRKQGSLL